MTDAEAETIALEIKADGGQYWDSLPEQTRQDWLAYVALRLTGKDQG